MDGSCKNGKMGSGCGKFREEGADKCARVGREEEGTISNRTEFGGVVLALQLAALSEDVLLLCYNEAVLCAIKKCGQEGKTTLVNLTRNSLPANATRARRESYFSDKGDVASRRSDQRAS